MNEQKPIAQKKKRNHEYIFFFCSKKQKKIRKKKNEIVDGKMKCMGMHSRINVVWNSKVENEKQEEERRKFGQFK